jgi:hypothetical protein
MDANATMVPLRITVSSANLASELLAYLRGLGADARTESDKVIKVVRRHAVVPGEPSHQDRVEIEFVLRAWATQNRDARYKVEEAA